MPHYMISGSYTAEGAKALLAEGGTPRLEQAQGLIESLGGTLEAMYFTFGSNDIVGFCELPSDAAAAAASLSVSSSGVINVHVTAMLTGKDLDVEVSFGLVPVLLLYGLDLFKYHLYRNVHHLNTDFIPVLTGFLKFHHGLSECEG